MYMSWKRQKEFVERYIRFARQTAWGENLSIPPAASRPSAADSDDDDDSEEAPQPRNRRERRMQQKENRKDKKGPTTKKQKARKGVTEGQEVHAGPQGATKRVVAENGKILLVDSLGDVYLEEEDEEGTVQAFLLDVSLLPPPHYGHFL
jgi:hypothetical protein